MVDDKYMTDKRFNAIVRAVHKELLNAPEAKRDEFLSANWGNHTLVEYHHTLGRHIRNKYKLWTYKHEPEIIDGVDHSPFHPDNISGKIIEEVWKLGNERITPDKERFYTRVVQ